ncbi:recombinase family protein [Vibrio campbellii]
MNILEVKGQYQKAYCYSRFSSLQQETGDSLRRQAEALRSAVQTLDVSLDCVTMLESKGKSAFSGKHIEETEALGKLLKDIEEGVITKEDKAVLLLDTVSRISRLHPTTAQNMLSKILDVMDIVIVKSGQVHSNSRDRYSISSAIVLLIELQTAHQESDTRSYMVRASYENRQKAILNYEEVQNRKRLVYWIDGEMVDGKAVYTLNEHSKTVERIVDLRLQQLGQNTIARMLNDECHPVPPSFRTGTWSARNVRMTLDSDALYGAYRVVPSLSPEQKEERKEKGLSLAYEDLPYTLEKGFFPAMATEEQHSLMKTVKKTIKSGKGAQNFYNVLRGIGKCECGKPYSVKLAIRDNQKVGLGEKLHPNMYLHCTNRGKDTNHKCTTTDRKYHKYTDFLETFTASIAHIRLDDTRIDKDEYAKLEAKRDTLNEEIDNLVGALASLPVRLQAGTQQQIKEKDAELSQVEELLQQMQYQEYLSQDALQENLQNLRYDDVESRQALNRKLKRVLEKVVFSSTNDTYDVYLKNGQVLRNLSVVGQGLTDLRRYQAEGRSAQYIDDARDSNYDDFID